MSDPRAVRSHSLPGPGLLPRQEEPQRLGWSPAHWQQNGNTGAPGAMRSDGAPELSQGPRESNPAPGRRAGQKAGRGAVGRRPRSPEEPQDTPGTSSTAATAAVRKAGDRAALAPTRGPAGDTPAPPPGSAAPTGRPRPSWAPRVAHTYRSGSARGSSAGWAARPPSASQGRPRGRDLGLGQGWGTGCCRPRGWAPRPPPRSLRGSPRSAGTWWPEHQPQPPGPRAPPELRGSSLVGTAAGGAQV